MVQFHLAITDKSSDELTIETEWIIDKHKYCDSGADWDKISGREISHSSSPSHTPTTNSETWTTLLAYLYDYHIKRSKSLVGP